MTQGRGGRTGACCVEAVATQSTHLPFFYILGKGQTGFSNKEKYKINEELKRNPKSKY